MNIKSMKNNYKIAKNKKRGKNTVFSKQIFLILKKQSNENKQNLKKKKNDESAKEKKK
ncbi:hypothetical protein [uncultured Methanobrevibacter sp.]|uniref:hypothetical protein n=1 Tax=uncultured Methanobrevibacter sp. TaxID=253161 RepID=UPI0025F019D3|nr:hypothetical protein [uncultured Methanobrevibacter sp.]